MTIATGAYIPLSDDERLKIEAEVEHHKIEAARLIRRLNASTLVMRLPDELLAEVIMLYVRSWHDDDTSKFYWSRTPHYGWLRLTHVCHRWREVALNTPALWTNIKVTSPEVVTSFIARSGNLPFHVRFFGTDMRGEEELACWMPILRASSRAHYLHIKLGNSLPTFSPVYESGRELLLTELRVLDLDYTTASQRTLPSFVSPRLPQLHTLTSYLLPYQVIKSLLVPSLRSLLLGHLRMRDSSMWRLFFEALKQLTRLEHLTLIDSFRPLPADWRQLPLFADAVVVLPVLRSLQLACGTFSVGVALALRNLCIPGDVSVEITEARGFPLHAFREDGPQNFQEDGVHCLLSVLESRLSGNSSGALTPPPPVLTLALQSHHGPSGSGEENLKGWYSVIPLDTVVYESGPDMTPSTTLHSLSFSMRWFSEITPADLLVEKLSLVSALQQVQAFAIDTHGDHGAAPVSPGSLQAGLASLHRVETAFARGRGVEPLLTALRTPWGLEKQLLFPSLKTLHIFGYQFVHPWSFGCNLTNVEDLELEVDLVKHTLVERAQEGLRLDKLIISRCNGISREELKELGGLVRELTWDGTGVADSPPPDSGRAD